MTQSTLALIGGSGLYEIGGLRDARRHAIETPYGVPSDEIVEGVLGSTRLLFLSRHGSGHRIAPHQVNYRANICALKMLGATHLLSVSAVGSMKEEVRPSDVVVVDQFIDRTRMRNSTFFDEGIVAHVAFGDPVCQDLSSLLVESARYTGAPVHPRGTYMCIDGPQFSTRAESQWYRSIGVDVIGMTAMPEARLAREAQLPYALLALVTDYDCWHESADDVTVEAVLSVLRSNAVRANAIVARVAETLQPFEASPARTALTNAVITDPSRAPTEEARTRLSWLL